MSQAATEPVAVVQDGRARILGAGRALFIQNGFTGVSMQQIADAAGVNKATLYHHFADKEALFVEVLRREFAHIHEQLNAMVTEHGSIREQLIEVARRMLDTSTLDIGRLMADLRQYVSTERRDELMRQGSPPWESLTAIFQRASAGGEIAALDPSLLSRLFFVMIGSQLGWPKFGGWAPPEDVAVTIVGIMLDGISLSSDPDDRARD